MVIASHADDEVLGVGATLASHAKVGDDTHVVILSHSITSRPVGPEAQAAAAEHRHKACHQAVRSLGVQSLSIHGYPDNAFDTVPFLDLVRAIGVEVDTYRPTLIYTHHPGDLSRDHRITTEAVLTASRPNRRGTPSIVSFEVRSATDWSSAAANLPPFQPNLWFAVDREAVDKKLSALEIYASEMREWPHSRSVRGVRALLEHRGAQAGVEAAEAFVLLRHIEDRL
jgi:LmbE family N-acetylglucosaminyl deacetylase